MSQEIIKPSKLSPGDTLMVISPAAGLAGIDVLRHRADKGITTLKEMGFIDTMTNGIRN